MPKADEEEEPPILDKDKHYIPVASRLPVNIETKEISKEKAPETPKDLNKTVLVMPRIIRLAPKQLTSTNGLIDYYKLISLNGASSASSATPDCPNINFTTENTYKCTVGGTNTSNIFYVIIGKGGSLIEGSSSSGSNNSSSSTENNKLFCSVQAPTSSAPTTIPKPTVKCGNTELTSSFSYEGAPSSTSPPWTNVANGTYTIKVSVPAGPSQQCSGQTVDCGTVVVGSNNNSGTLACNLINKNGTSISYLTTLTLTQGENFRAKATCNGTQENYPTFSTATGNDLPQGGSLQNNGNAYYTTSQSTGEYTITASLNCGGSYQTVTCGTVKVQKPTCTISGNYAINASVSVPTSSCGNASASDAKFNITGANDGGTPTTNLNWNNNPPSAVNFGNAGEKRKVRMYQISCDSHTLNYGTSDDKNGIECGSINIGSTCAYAYQSDWCNGRQTAATSVPTTSPSGSNPHVPCLFVSDIKRIQVQNGKVNGTQLTNNNGSYFACGQWGKGSCADLLPAKKDGGYYISNAANSDWISDYEFTTGSPTCSN